MHTTTHPEDATIFVHRDYARENETGRPWYRAVVEFAEDGFLVTRGVGGSCDKQRAHEIAKRWTELYFWGE